MFSKSIYFGEKFAIFAPMRKELGKWFMDIAKYLLTAVVVGALISDIENSRWLVYVGGIGATLSCLLLAWGYFGRKKQIKHRRNKYGGILDFYFYYCFCSGNINLE